MGQESTTPGKGADELTFKTLLAEFGERHKEREPVDLIWKSDG